MTHTTIVALAAAATLALGACATTTEPVITADATPAPSIDTSAALEPQLVDAISDGDLALVEALIAAGADVNADVGGGATSLHRAAARGEEAIVLALLDAGAVVDGPGSLASPLFLAAGTGDYATVVALIEAGADVARPEGQYGTTPWHHAGREGNVDTMQAFLDSGVDIDVLEDTSSTALMYAAYNGELDAVALLVEQGADLNARDNIDVTALGWAQQQGHTEVADILAAAGATV